MGAFESLEPACALLRSDQVDSRSSNGRRHSAADQWSSGLSKSPQRSLDGSTIEDRILADAAVEAVFAHIEDVVHRAILRATYGAGLRISEACRQGIADIDSKRGLIPVLDEEELLEFACGVVA